MPEARSSGRRSGWSALRAALGAARRARLEGGGETASLRWGLPLVAALAVVALAAPWLAPYPPNEQLDPAGAAERPPGTVLAAVETAAGWRLADRVERTDDGLIMERRGRRYELAAEEVLNLTAEGVADRRVFLLGTDRYGRDLLSRLLHGARISLTLALLAVALALTLGVAVGAAASVGGAWVDGLLMRTVDALLAFPRLFLLLALTALLHPSNWLLVLVLGGTGWMGVSRVVRAELTGIREREFVLAARATGLSTRRILLRHMLPNALSPLLALAALLVGDVILAESALSFLGLGIAPPQASWGTIINDGRDSLVSAWWVAALPGAAIAMAVVAFNLVGDGLRDALDPHLRGRRRRGGRDASC